MRSSFLVILYISLFSTGCKKEIIADNNNADAVYQLTFTGTWTSPALTVPPSAHFTPIVGALHNNEGNIFTLNRLASTGVEALAEDGNAFPLLTEIDTLVRNAKASGSFILFFPGINSASSMNLYVNSRFSQCSFITMLAPTPDWFTGISGFDLRPAGQWISDTTINVYTWDAGTENGDVFDQTNAPTIPAQVVQLLTPQTGSVLANGNVILPAVGKVRFLKQKGL
jgi:Spondin_N